MTLYLKTYKMKVPMKREMGYVDCDMVAVIVSLTSDDSSYINGQIILINGGRNMLCG